LIPLVTWNGAEMTLTPTLMMGEELLLRGMILKISFIWVSPLMVVTTISEGLASPRAVGFPNLKLEGEAQRDQVLHLSVQLMVLLPPLVLTLMHF